MDVEANFVVIRRTMHAHLGLEETNWKGGQSGVPQAHVLEGRDESVEPT